MSQLPHKGVRVLLGAHAFILPPASLATLEEFGPRLDAFNAKLSDAASLQLSDFGVAADFIHACLLRNYPEIDRKTITQSVDLGNLQEVMRLCYDASGLLRRAQEQEDAKEASAASQEGGKLGESIGMASSLTS